MSSLGTLAHRLGPVLGPHLPLRSSQAPQGGGKGGEPQNSPHQGVLTAQLASAVALLLECFSVTYKTLDEHFKGLDF